MEPSTVGLIGVGVMVVLLALEVPIAYAMGSVGLVGFIYFMSIGHAASMAIITAYTDATSYTLVTIPLFVLMGNFAFGAGIGKDLYDGLYAWMWRLKGGLAMATSIACGAFGAICGSSPVTAITIGSIALPEMDRYKYQKQLSTGCIAASGTLGILIPPSIPMVVYGVITEQSIGKLFIAGILPGILTVCIFMIMIYIRVKINPSLAPQGPSVPLKERIRLTGKAWSVVAVFIVVIGGIYSGLFTPTEAASIGALSVFVVGAAKRRFNRERLIKSLKDSVQLSGMILAIIIGGMVYTGFIIVSGLPDLAYSLMSHLGSNRYVILCFILFVYLILGSVMEILGMMLFSLPLFFPTIMELGFDPIWFGVMVMVVCEVGQITPPFGLNCMVIKSISSVGVSTADIFVGVGWFFLMELIVILLLIIFPGIALILPNLMYAR